MLSLRMILLVETIPPSDFSQSYVLAWNINLGMIFIVKLDTPISSLSLATSVVTGSGNILHGVVTGV